MTVDLVAPGRLDATMRRCLPCAEHVKRYRDDWRRIDHEVRA
jgi:hypothetical protein